MINIFLDIETMPGPDWCQELLAENIHPPPNYKNPEAIEKWWAETGDAKMAEAKLKTALFPPLGQIGVIAYAINDQPVKVADAKDSEFELLSWFLAELERDVQEASNRIQSTIRYRFVGFNVIEFDLRFLFFRLMANHLDSWIMFPHEAKSWDTRKAFDCLFHMAGRQTTHYKLDIIARALGLEPKLDGMSGADVVKLMIEGGDENWAKACLYCAHDVTLTREVYRRMVPYWPELGDES